MKKRQTVTYYNHHLIHNRHFNSRNAVGSRSQIKREFFQSKHVLHVFLLDPWGPEKTLARISICLDRVQEPRLSIVVSKTSACIQSHFIGKRFNMLPYTYRLCSNKLYTYMVVLIYHVHYITYTRSIKTMDGNISWSSKNKHMQQKHKAKQFNPVLVIVPGKLAQWYQVMGFITSLSRISLKNSAVRDLGWIALLHPGDKSSERNEFMDFLKPVNGMSPVAADRTFSVTAILMDSKNAVTQATQDVFCLTPL